MQRRRASSLLLASVALGWAPRALAQDLAQIRARGELRIGTSGTAPPNTWVNARNELVGYDIDWGSMIGRELGLPGALDPGGLPRPDARAVVGPARHGDHRRAHSRAPEGGLPVLGAVRLRADGRGRAGARHDDEAPGRHPRPRRRRRRRVVPGRHDPPHGRLPLAARDAWRQRRVPVAAHRPHRRRGRRPDRGDLLPAGTARRGPHRARRRRRQRARHRDGEDRGAAEGGRPRPRRRALPRGRHLPRALYRKNFGIEPPGNEQPVDHPARAASSA